MKRSALLNVECHDIVDAKMPKAVSVDSRANHFLERLSQTKTIFAGTGTPCSFSPISTMTEARIFARLRCLRIFR
ncbi:MAG: hypothetical protein WCJ37_00320 [Syntrophus sp. (in: bacteria)]